MTTPVLRSRLPAVGTTLFTRMSVLAAQHGEVHQYNVFTVNTPI